MELTQNARWAASMYAEQVTVVTEDEAMLTVDLELLPPAGERIGLIILASGPSTKLVEPTALQPEAFEVIQRLAEHHAKSPAEAVEGGTVPSLTSQSVGGPGDARWTDRAGLRLTR